MSCNRESPLSLACGVVFQLGTFETPEQNELTEKFADLPANKKNCITSLREEEKREHTGLQGGSQTLRHQKYQLSDDPWCFIHEPRHVAAK